jgi:hypothetical protein
MGHDSKSLHGPPGENQEPCGGKQEKNVLHEVEGHVRKRHRQRQLKRTWAPTGSTEDAGNSGRGDVGRWKLPLFDNRPPSL